MGKLVWKFSANAIILFTHYNDAMHKKRRDREEIMYEILSAAIEPVTRTRLIYASFLSNTELRQYITLLVENQMLEVDPFNNTRFKVTEVGRKFLSLYSEMIRMTTGILR